eukprot:8493974-Prorocentrum_lima.AAC.1
MTSSLVGSEMCIRDRPKVVCRRSRGLRLASGGTAPHKRLRKLVWFWPSVSYTHLTLPTICSV